jgi:hypothetical protein
MVSDNWHGYCTRRRVILGARRANRFRKTTHPPVCLAIQAETLCVTGDQNTRLYTHNRSFDKMATIRT